MLAMTWAPFVVFLVCVCVCCFFDIICISIVLGLNLARGCGKRKPLPRYNQKGFPNTNLPITRGRFPRITEVGITLLIPNPGLKGNQQEHLFFAILGFPEPPGLTHTRLRIRAILCEINSFPFLPAFKQMTGLICF